jgi:hypothetical protein
MYMFTYFMEFIHAVKHIRPSGKINIVIIYTNVCIDYRINRNLGLPDVFLLTESYLSHGVKMTQQIHKDRSSTLMLILVHTSRIWTALSVDMYNCTYNKQMA